MKKFKARLKMLDGSGNAPELRWRVLDVPFDVKKAFGKGGTVPVKGTINGFAFRTSLFPRKGGPHFLLTNKTMQRGAGIASLGDLASVELELDTQERTVTIPPLLKKVLEEEEELLAYYDSFSYSMRKYFADYVTQAKSPSIRQRRAEELAVTLMQMKDGEVTPPPILEVEFARNPKARKGWELMPPSHRRSNLWGIFYYKNPDSRAKRVSKAIEQMVAYSERKKK